MKCPMDGETLVMTERSGVEIDYCPKCRGVWLDRGELDKIIERAAPVANASAPPAARPAAVPDLHGRKQYDADERLRTPKRRDSFLSDLFDF